MRYKLLIILPLIVLICSSLLAMNAHSISDTEGKSADQLIDESNGIVDRSDQRYPATPQEAREIELGSSEKTSTRSSQASSSQESRATGTASSDGQIASQEEENDSNATEASGETPSMDLSGSWTMSLDDGRDLDLMLYQNGKAVFGTGSMEDGNATSLVAASGSLAGDKLNLDIVSFGSINLYRLTLIQSGDSIVGSYSAIQPSGTPTSGSASASRYS
jgi:hypothetical protein